MVWFGFVLAMVVFVLAMVWFGVVLGQEDFELLELQHSAKTVQTGRTVGSFFPSHQS